ncbi:MAG: 4Fe-4S binding protein [Sphaerochaeta sp.]|nr:4Fe-4S binding protein [Sphaerochaeta sp.]
MAFDFAKFFGISGNEAASGPKKLMVNPKRCPQNHPCPAIRVCPVGALTQKGYAAPVVNKDKCIDCGKCSRYCAFGALAMKSV